MKVKRYSKNFTTSERSDSLGPKLGARIYGIIWGDANVNKHGGKRSGMFKTVQNSKTEGGIERRRKHKNVKLKEEDVPGAILPLEKNH